MPVTAEKKPWESFLWVSLEKPSLLKRVPIHSSNDISDQSSVDLERELGAFMEG